MLHSGTYYNLFRAPIAERLLQQITVNKFCTPHEFGMSVFKETIWEAAVAVFFVCHRSVI
jgi:hypothetical protein